MNFRTRIALGGRTAAVALGLLVTAVVMGSSPAGAAPSPNNSNLNHPSYYEDLGYGTCTKDDGASTPYSLGTPPSGNYWTLLVLKAGSASSNSDWNTLIENPSPGNYVHPSGKQISHTISCYDSGGGGSTTTTAPTTSTTVPGGGCEDYVPTAVAVNPITVHELDPITISGSATPGDTVTATISGGPHTNVSLGTAVVDALGQFSISAIVPSGSTPGNYSVSVTSSSCPTAVVVTIVVAGSTFSGCGENNAGRTFQHGEQVDWELHNNPFDTSKPVSLVLDNNGYTNTLYSGAWPASNVASIVIPGTAPTGKYFMVQIGQKKNGKTYEKKCPVWVEEALVLAAFSGAPISEPTDSDPISAPQLAVLTLAGLGALRLRTLSRKAIRARRIM